MKAMRQFIHRANVEHFQRLLERTMNEAAQSKHRDLSDIAIVELTLQPKHRCDVCSRYRPRRSGANALAAAITDLSCSSLRLTIERVI
jgi:hypothetical protein